MKQWLTDYAEDLLIVAGLGVIVGTTFAVHIIAGWYALGVTLVAAGLTLARMQARGR